MLQEMNNDPWYKRLKRKLKIEFYVIKYLGLKLWLKGKIKMKNINWISTDPDSNQFGRKISEKVFEFKEKNPYSSNYDENEYIQLKIDLNEYSEKEIENYISAYYNNIKELKEIYGEDSNWIIAECIFEQKSGLY